MSTPEITDAKEDKPASEDIRRASNEHRDVLGRPRDTDQTSQPSETSKREMPAYILHPPPVWKFNKFLSKLAAQIDEQELKRLKDLFIDDIGRGILKNITTATELFDIMRKRLYLDPDNLIALQSILMELKRPELTELAIEYAEEVGEVVYCRRASSEQENGTTKIKIHVAGKDFRNWKRDYIERLRENVSRWLFIPLKHVVISGIEPSSSMYITLLIPDAYAEVLRKNLKYKSARGPLHELQIDIIKIGEKTYNIGVDDGTERLTGEQTQFVNVYEQLEDKKMQLQISEDENLKLRKEVNVLKKTNDTLEMENITFQNIFLDSDAEEADPNILANQKASMQCYKDSLRVTIEQGYDKKCIQKLLQSSIRILAIRTEQARSIERDKLLLHVKDIESQLVPLQLELEFHKRFGLKEREQPAGQYKGPQVLNERGLVIMCDISKRLTVLEKQKLENKYTWKPDEYWTMIKTKDESVFLACLFHKEIERQQSMIDFDKFVIDCLDEVGRPDLKERFMQINRDLVIAKPLVLVSRDQQPTSQSSKPEATNMTTTKMAEDVTNILGTVSEILRIIKSSQNAATVSGQFGISQLFSSLFSGETVHRFDGSSEIEQWLKVQKAFAVLVKRDRVQAIVRRSLKDNNQPDLDLTEFGWKKYYESALINCILFCNITTKSVFLHAHTV